MSYEKYFKSVSHLDVIDVYRVLDLFSVTDHALGHAAKKILLCGVRTGGKDPMQEIIEARDTLNRWIEMQAENAVWPDTTIKAAAFKSVMPDAVTGNWPASADERMEPIMQNGNNGDHYDELDMSDPANWREGDWLIATSSVFYAGKGEGLVFLNYSAHGIYVERSCGKRYLIDSEYLPAIKWHSRPSTEEIIQDNIVTQSPGDVFIQTEDGETARFSAAGYAASKEQ